MDNTEEILDDATVDDDRELLDDVTVDGKIY